MKKMMKKTLLSFAVTAACGLASSSAMAVVYENFVVNEGTGVPDAGKKVFTADKIVGGYSEVITFNTNNTFDVSLLWQAGQYFANQDGLQLKVGSELGGSGTKGYELYALYRGAGTFSTDGTNTTFNFTPGGTLKVFIDPESNTGFTAPTSGADAFGRTARSDDYLIATGVPQSGEGGIDTTLSTCGKNGNNCGSFGATTTFDLTDKGSKYFVAPSPFYQLSFQSGQLNNIPASGTRTINGSLDVVFGNPVPEPTTVALLGLGLLGLAASRRKLAKGNQA